MATKQPKIVPTPAVAGYGNNTVNLDAVQDAFGKYPSDAQQKVTKTMRGAGAATKGKTFKESVVK